MKIYRVRLDDETLFAIRQGDFLELCDTRSLTDIVDGRYEATGRRIALAKAALEAPVVPGKIVAVGRNYADHAKELGNAPPSEPLIFLKPASAVISSGQQIVLPHSSGQVDFEGELAIVIGKKARNVAGSQWRSVVAGFTCANDVTARDLQKRDVQFTRGKSFDTFCPLGPCIQTELDLSDLGLSTRLNGQLRQHGRTSQMIFSPAVIIEFITAIMTLEPGDVILTGTPSGVGAMKEGDVVEVEIEGIGILRNSVRT